MRSFAPGNLSREIGPHGVGHLHAVDLRRAETGQLGERRDVVGDLRLGETLQTFERAFGADVVAYGDCEVLDGDAGRHRSVDVGGPGRGHGLDHVGDDSGVDRRNDDAMFGESDQGFRQPAQGRRDTDDRAAETHGNRDGLFVLVG